MKYRPRRLFTVTTNPASDTDACDEVIDHFGIHFGALLVEMVEADITLICLLPSSCIKQHGQLAPFTTSYSLAGSL
jgi:hypothetical protein